MTGEGQKVKPWVVILAGDFFARAESRKAAQRAVERPYRPGFVTIKNERTGEAWKRDRGSWFRTQDSIRQRRSEARAAGSDHRGSGGRGEDAA